MRELDYRKRLSNAESQNQLQARSLFRQNLIKTGLFVCLAVVTATSMARAQAGQLDTTFATKGVFLLNSNGNQGGSTGVAVQADGKIVFAAPSGDPQKANNGIALVRLNTDGTPDSSFGTAGVVVFGIERTVPSAVVIQPDGKIVVGSVAAQSADGPASFGLARFNSNGSVDNSFGTGGQVFGLEVLGSAFALQPDGKILVTGGNTLVRFETNGQLDSTFANGGLTALPFTFAGAIALQSDGKILIASAAIGGADTSGNIVRFNPNGTLDKTFGLFGEVASVSSGGIFDPTGAGVVSGIVLQADGKFVVAGTITSKLINPPGSSHTGFGIVRYNPNGSIDTSFGNHGGVLTPFGSNANATAFALAIQSNGDIVAAGQAGSSLALSRYSSAGRLDATFGSSGIVTTSLGSNPSAISSLILQNDGKIVAGSATFSVDSTGFHAQAAVERYLAQ